MHQLNEIIGTMAGKRVIVIGDAMLDEYLYGQATRISREAPVPVLEYTERRVIPGGAANPAVNAARLGAHTTLIGVIGGDAAGQELRAALSERGVDTSGLIVAEKRPTVVKQRIMAQMGLRFPQQVARIDRIDRSPLAESQRSAVLEMLARCFGEQTVDVVLVSDYRSGLIDSALGQEIVARCRASGVRLAVDAQGDFDKYIGCGVLKCNADEAASYLGTSLQSDADFARAAASLADRLQIDVGVFITRGAAGITVGMRQNGAATATHVPARHVEDVFDTVGAGDTAIAVIALALASGADVTRAAVLANAASGIVVRRLGNYAPSPDELRAALEEGA
ncbi:MAG: ribokinase [Chloroflexi bacterium]|nr:ribokinase [Chloroflexota bacterium]